MLSGEITSIRLKIPQVRVKPGGDRRKSGMYTQVPEHFEPGFNVVSRHLRNFQLMLEAAAVFGIDNPDLSIALGVPYAGPLFRDRYRFTGIDGLNGAIR